MSLKIKKKKNTKMDIELLKKHFVNYIINKRVNKIIEKHKKQ
jgi:hypothetical protein